MNILILEDELTIRKAMRFALEKAGHAVQEFADPLKALDRAAEQRFDLMVVDLMLPHLPGYAFINRLNEQERLSPTIVLTSHAEEARGLIDQRQLGNIPLEIISKDLPFPDILKKIEQFLNPLISTQTHH